MLKFSPMNDNEKIDEIDLIRGIDSIEFDLCQIFEANLS